MHSAMRIALIALAIVIVLSVSMAPVGAAEPETVSVMGEPVDIQCYLAGRSGEAHASCARTCVEGGQPVGFLAIDDDGKEHLYLVIGAEQKPAKEYMAEHMGMEVTATGTLVTKNGMKILTVSKVEAVEDDEDWFPSEGPGSGSIQNQ